MRYLLGIIVIATVFFTLYIHYSYRAPANQVTSYPTTTTQPTIFLTVSPTPIEPTRNVYGDGCSDLADATFQSVRQYETGLGPDNHEAMGYWVIQFENTMNGVAIDPPRFSWRHSDVEESGSYVCKFNTITLKFNYDSLVATYNPTTHIIRWQDIEYKRMK